MIDDEEMRMMQIIAKVKDEEKDCKYYKGYDITNVCVGNEPYRCSRAKKEGLCHILHKTGEKVV